MAKVAWIIGNGPSRKGIDLEELEGTTFGCNALYRDFTPDVLVAMDFNICHEIYRSGYAFKNLVYLKQWTKCPASMYSKLFYKEKFILFATNFIVAWPTFQIQL